MDGGRHFVSVGASVVHIFWRGVVWYGVVDTSFSFLSSRIEIRRVE